MDVTPLRPFRASATLVPSDARPASVFLTTWYRAPAVRTVLRNSKSLATVSLENVPTIMLLAFFRSAFNFSICSAFFAFVTAMILSLSLCLGRSFHCSGVYRYPWPHGGGDVRPLDVLALGRGRLGAYHAADDGRCVLHQLVRCK